MRAPDDETLDIEELARVDVLMSAPDASCYLVFDARATELRVGALAPGVVVQAVEPCTDAEATRTIGTGIASSLGEARVPIGARRARTRLRIELLDGRTRRTVAELDVRPGAPRPGDRAPGTTFVLWCAGPASPRSPRVVSLARGDTLAILDIEGVSRLGGDDACACLPLP